MLYIGGIFAKEEMEQSSIFGYAIDRLNADQSMLARSRIQTHLALIDPDDSFHGEKKGKYQSIKSIYSLNNEQKNVI